MKKIYLVLIAILYVSFAASAQRSSSNFIETLNEAQVNFKPNQQQKLQNIRSNDMYKQVSLIRVGNLATIQKRGALPIEIPGRKGRLVAKVKSVEAISETEFVWIGEFIQEEGTVMIIAREGRVFGHITVGDDAYEIHDLGDQTNILVQINDNRFTEEECVSIDHGSSKEQVKTNTSGRVQNHLDIIRILVLFTQNAENTASNIQDVAFLAVQQMNTALVNSSIVNVDVELAGVQELNFTESGNIQTDVLNLAADGDAQTLRDNFEADIVLLLTDGNYGSIFGIVADIGPINNLAYGIVEVDAASGRYTFAHEAAHLVGARHETDPDPTFAHGHNFKTGIWPFQKTRRTILNTLPSGESRILYYSNPDVEYKNKETGTTDRDNARQFDEQAATVAAFRDFTPPLAVSISGPLYGDNSGTYTWTSSVSNGVAPYTYLWEYSTDGFNYSSFGTSTSVTAQLPYNNDLHLRLTVTDSNEAEATDFHFTSNNDGDTCIKCLDSDSTLITDSVETFIYPNPSESEINVVYETKVSNIDVNIVIYDFMGTVVFSKINTVPEMGRYTDQLNISGLSNGQYILKIQSGENSETKRLIISK